VELAQVADAVGGGRAAGAAGVAWVLVPVSVDVIDPHEVMHDQLRSTLEQVEQAHCPVWALERIRLVHSNHRKPATLRIDPAACLGEFLLLGQ
jgi:hypothetical protein